MRTLAGIVFITVLLLAPALAAAHGGGKNFSGCHWVWVNGVRVSYHCH